MTTPVVSGLDWMATRPDYGDIVLEIIVSFVSWKTKWLSFWSCEWDIAVMCMMPRYFHFRFGILPFIL